MDYEQIMTMGNCGELVEDQDSPHLLNNAIAKPEPIPYPDGNGWKLVTAVPLRNTDVIQYIWQREKR